MHYEKLFNKTLISQGRDPAKYNAWLTFLKPDKMRELNLKTRGINKATDVIAIEFDLPASDSKDIKTELGDIIICKSEARKKRLSKKFLYIHGLLHLLGHTHDTDEDLEKMHKLTEKILHGRGT